TANLLKARGATGDNYTGMAPGGFEVTAGRYMVAATSIDQKSSATQKVHNILLLTVPKDKVSDSNVQTRALTSLPASGDITAGVPYLVRVTNDRLVVIWSEFEVDGEFIGTKYVVVDGAGQPVSDVETSYLPTSQKTQPVYADGKIYWIYTGAAAGPIDQNARFNVYLCTLDLSSLGVDLPDGASEDDDAEEDAENTGEIELHGVGLGMALSQVQTALGTPKNSFALSSTETWHIFHTDYKNFIAVGMISGKVAAVCSMAPSWSSQLKSKTTGAPVTHGQADAADGAGAKVYTDGTAELAVLLYDEMSGIVAARSFEAGAAEQLMFHTINAYRVLNNSSALVWNAKLGSSARAHTSEMGYYGYLSETGRSGSTFATRAYAQGYERQLVSFGAVAGGGANVFDFLHDYISASGKRSQILSAALTVMGTGFGSGYAGNYKSLGTVVFGTLIGITNVTWSPASADVNAGGSVTVSLTVTPSNRNETFAAASSDTNCATVTTVTATTFTVTGKTQGSANITITGNSSGAVFTIPVSVGAAYASRLTIRNESNTAIVNNASASVSAAGTYILSKGNTYQFSAAATPAAASEGVAWISSDTSVATVSPSGLVTGVGDGAAQIKARVQKSAGTDDFIEATINVTVVTMSYRNGGEEAVSPVTLDLTQIKSLRITPYLTGYPQNAPAILYSGSSNYPSIAAVASAYAADVTVTGKSTGSARITVAAAVSYSSGYVVKVAGYFDVEVASQLQYATDFSLTPESLTVDIGQAKEIAVTTTPASVANRTLAIDDNFEAYKVYVDIIIDNSAGKIFVTGKAETPASVPAMVYVTMPAEGSATISKSFAVTVTPATVTGVITNDGAAPASISNGSAIGTAALDSVTAVASGFTDTS
ncbi:MAG: Ig-like domain-containing protein, partial [Oscillospiraceae bacterium]|nr:Ig-like domain-containing protein [Oscillospiraceae bacterium]